ncbi:hypothetical protein FRC07_006705, partial [Ceratobasidium sp. 392]
MAALGPGQLIGIAMFHCTLQGASVPLLVNFLDFSKHRSSRFRGYVVFVNLVALMQTIVHVMLALDVIKPQPPNPSLLLDVPLLTNIQRLLPILPFLVLCVTGTLSGLVAVACILESELIWTREVQVTVAIWIFSLLLLDLMMTASTIVYLYRSHNGLAEHGGIFSVVWQVTWASAIPPLVLMMVPVVAQFVDSGPSHAAALIPFGMSGKFFLLSLMISLVGRGYVRGKLAELSEPTGQSNSTSGRDGVISLPVFARGNSSVYERRIRTDFLGPQASSLSQEPRPAELCRLDVRPTGGKDL